MSDSPSTRILFITTVGVTQFSFLRGQNPYLAQRGFELHAIASPGPKLDALAQRDGVNIHPVPISRRITPCADLISLLRIIGVLLRVRPQIVHVSTPKAALLGAIAAWLVRVPIRIYFVRGLTSENAKGIKRRLFSWAERLTASLCHRTICVSQSLLDFARSQKIVPAGAGKILANGMSNGIDTERFDRDQIAPAEIWERHAPDDQPVVVGFVGRLAQDKGIEELHQTWQSLRGEFPELRLLLVGNWEAEDPVRPEIRASLESDRRVHLTGYVADVAPYYRAMSIFAFASHGTEGFPNAPMEAAAMQLPVIASRVVGCVDAVEQDVTGRLIPPRDADALESAIRQYAADAPLRRQHGLAGRQRVVREFRCQRIWHAIWHEYVELLQAYGLAVPAASESHEHAPVATVEIQPAITSPAKAA